MMERQGILADSSVEEFNELLEDIRGFLERVTCRMANKRWVTKGMTRHEFPAASGLDGSYDVLRDRDTPELSAGDTILVDTHPWLAFERSQYVTVERSETVAVRNFGGTFECSEK
jgi:hypothetical protein